MTSARKPVDRDDSVMTIVGLLLLVPGVAGLAFYSVAVFFVSDSCGMPVTECNRELILAGHHIAKYGTIGIGLVALVASVLLMRSRRRAAWVPPVAAVLALGVFIGGGEFAKLGVQPGPGPEWSSTDRPARL